MQRMSINIAKCADHKLRVLIYRLVSGEGMQKAVQAWFIRTAQLPRPRRRQTRPGLQPLKRAGLFSRREKVKCVHLYWWNVGRLGLAFKAPQCFYLGIPPTRQRRFRQVSIWKRLVRTSDFTFFTQQLSVLINQSRDYLRRSDSRVMLFRPYKSLIRLIIQSWDFKGQINGNHMPGVARVFTPLENSKHAPSTALRHMPRGTMRTDSTSWTPL